MKIRAVCVGTARSVPGRSFKSGIWKSPVSGPVMIDHEGLVGDAICNRKHHGGPDQAIYAEGSETLAWWESELGQPIEPGTFGENLVIEGLDNRDLAAGDRLIAGDVVLEATAPRTPCATFAARMDDPTFVKRYTEAARAGVYFRVIAPGFIEAGQPVAFEPHGGDRIAIAEIMASIRNPPRGEELARYLDAPISIRMKEFFREKAV